MYQSTKAYITLALLFLGVPSITAMQSNSNGNGHNTCTHNTNLVTVYDSLKSLVQDRYERILDLMRNKHKIAKAIALAKSPEEQSVFHNQLFYTKEELEKAEARYKILVNELKQVKKLLNNNPSNSNALGSILSPRTMFILSHPLQKDSFEDVFNALSEQTASTAVRSTSNSNGNGESSVIAHLERELKLAESRSLASSIRFENLGRDIQNIQAEYADHNAESKDLDLKIAVAEANRAALYAHVEDLKKVIVIGEAQKQANKARESIVQTVIPQIQPAAQGAAQLQPLHNLLVQANAQQQADDARRFIRQAAAPAIPNGAANHVEGQLQPVRNMLDAANQALQAPVSVWQKSQEVGCRVKDTVFEHPYIAAGALAALGAGALYTFNKPVREKCNKTAVKSKNKLQAIWQSLKQKKVKVRDAAGLVGTAGIALVAIANRAKVVEALASTADLSAYAYNYLLNNSKYSAGALATSAAVAGLLRYAFYKKAQLHATSIAQPILVKRAMVTFIDSLTLFQWAFPGMDKLVIKAYYNPKILKTNADCWDLLSDAQKSLINQLCN